MNNQSITASLQKGVARIDGKFWVNDDSVNFEPFNEQVALGPYHLDRAAIRKVENIMGKGGGILPTTSEAIRITMNDASSYEFILSGAKNWANMLSQ